MELTIFAAPDDIETAWRYILNSGMKALPDPYFGQTAAPVFSSYGDVSANLREYPSVAPALGYFLVSEEWSEELLLYRECADNPNFEPHWYVQQRYSGPSIHFIPRFGYPQPGKAGGELIAGMLSDYPFYYSTGDKSKIIKRPKSLSDAFTMVKKSILEGGGIVRSSSGKRAVAMVHALTACSEGVVLKPLRLSVRKVNPAKTFYSSLGFHVYDEDESFYSC
jgi:hypothetical protein